MHQQALLVLKARGIGRDVNPVLGLPEYGFVGPSFARAHTVSVVEGPPAGKATGRLDRAPRAGFVHSFAALPLLLAFVHTHLYTSPRDAVVGLARKTSPIRNPCSIPDLCIRNAAHDLYEKGRSTTFGEWSRPLVYPYFRATLP
jgi:hypothetical protein